MSLFGEACNCLMSPAGVAAHLQIMNVTSQLLRKAIDFTGAQDGRVAEPKFMPATAFGIEEVSLETAGQLERCGSYAPGCAFFLRRGRIARPCQVVAFSFQIPFTR